MSMVTADKDDRVMIFVDARNVIGGATEEIPGPYPIDFEEMVTILLGSRRLKGAYVFDGKGTSRNDETTKKFHNYLRRIGFRVIERDSCDTGEREQKEVDVAMACEMVLHAVNDNYDTAIIVSGDRDFVPAVEHIQRLGKTVEVASFESCKSSFLKKAADKYTNLSRLPIINVNGPEWLDMNYHVRDAEDKEEDETVIEETAEVN